MNADLADILETYGDADAMQYVGDGSVLSVADAKHWLEVTAKNWETRGYGMMAIEDEQGRFVGCAGIVHPNQQDEPEIKYCLKRAHWGFGFATEVVLGLTNWGYHVLGIKRFIASVAPEHSASQNVLTKARFSLIERRESAQVWEFIHFCDESIMDS